MFTAYLRIVVTILALIGAVVLFAFAFTTAAVIVLVLLAVGLIAGLIMGRAPGATVWVVRREELDATRQPPTIDHDPNDLPPDRKS